MAIEIVVPQIGEAISELTLTQWLKEVGDTVQKGDVLFEVDSDKAIVEVEAFADGTITEIIHGDGAAVLPQQVVGVLLEAGEQPAGVTESPATLTETLVDGGASTRKVSPVAERIAEENNLDLAEIKGSGPGGRITAVDVRAALPPDQVNGDDEVIERVVASPRARRIAEELGVTLADVGGTGVDGMVTSDDVERVMSRTPAISGRVNASPKAKRLAHERGIDLDDLKGTGIEGMIVTADLPQLIPATPASDGSTVEMGRLRQVIARRTAESKKQVPHFYLTVDADMTGSNNLRQYCAETLDWQRPPTYTDILTRACALAIAEMPGVNRSYHDGRLVSRARVNIGVAVSTDMGLVVPVLSDANERSLQNTAQSLREIVDRTRQGRVKPGELGEKSMVISNLGMYGIDRFIAIIDMPDPMILAVGQVADRVVARNGQMVILPMMTLSLSVDHRVLDGTEAAQFLTRVKDRLENPFDILG